MSARKWSGALLALLFIGVPTTVTSQQHSHHHQPQHQHEQTQYMCPMHPQILSEQPGTCPICGMDLELQGGTQHQQEVWVSGAMQQNLAIQTEPVQIETLRPQLTSVAQIQWNGNSAHHIHSRAAGWIEKLHVRSEGTQVTLGQPLYEIYSRELVVAQQDLLQAIRSNASQTLIQDAKLRLQLLGFAPQLIAALERDQTIRYRVPVYANQAGVVTAMNIAQGMYVEPGVAMMSIQEADPYWVIADVPEHYADWFLSGAPVQLDVPAAGVHQYDTVIDYIYPQLDPQARTQRVRTLLPHPQGNSQVLVGMQVQATLFGTPREHVLTVPRSSLLITGHENRVIVKTAAETFAQRQVQVGHIVGERAEILQGLHPGEQVVVAGQFLLDSEATLLQARFGSTAQEAPHAHAHH